MCPPTPSRKPDWLHLDDRTVTNAVNKLTQAPAHGMAPYGDPISGNAADLSRLLERALNTLEPNARPPWATELADRLRPLDAGQKAPNRFIVHLLGY